MVCSERFSQAVRIQWGRFCKENLKTEGTLDLRIGNEPLPIRGIVRVRFPKEARKDAHEGLYVSASPPAPTYTHPSPAQSCQPPGTGSAPHRSAARSTPRAQRERHDSQRRLAGQYQT